MLQIVVVELDLTSERKETLTSETKLSILPLAKKVITSSFLSRDRNNFLWRTSRHGNNFPRRTSHQSFRRISRRGKKIPRWTSHLLGLLLTFEGDYIFIVSDGVYDNFDPEHLGLLPNQLVSKANFSSDDSDFLKKLDTFKDWAELPNDLCTKAKEDFILQKFEEMYVL